MLIFFFLFLFQKEFYIAFLKGVLCFFDNILLTFLCIEKKLLKNILSVLFICFKNKLCHMSYINNMSSKNNMSYVNFIGVK